MTVQAVQSFKTNNFKANLADYDSKSNAMSKMDNSKSIIDLFTKSNQVTFKGNLAKAGENLLGDASSKVGGKIRRLGEEASEVIGGAFRKLTGKDELPITEKSIIAAVESRWTTSSKKLLGELDKNNIYVGNIPADRVGGIPSSYKPGIESAIDKAVKDGKIPEAKGDALKSDLKFCGDDAGDISSASLGDDISRGYDGGGADGGDFDCNDLDFDSLMSLLSS